MKVTLKTLQQKTFTVEAEDGWKVKDLKEAIAKEKGDVFPADGQKLIFSGKILQDDVSLSEYSLTETSFIVIMASKPKRRDPAAAAPAPAPAPAPAAEPTPTPATTTPATTTSPPVTTQQPTESAPPATTQQSSSQQSTDGGPAPAPSTGDANLVRQAMGMVPDEEKVEQLAAMGFEPGDIRRALRASFNNAERAVEYLMNGIPETLLAEMAMDTMSAPPAAPASQTPAGGSGSAPAVNPSQPAPTQPTASEEQAMDALRAMPQFEQVRQVIRSNPQMLPALLQQIGRQNPSLLSLISQNQQAFIDMMNEAGEGEGGGTPAPPVGGGGGGGGGGGSGPIVPGAGGEGPVMYVTAEEKAAIERLKALGFDEYKVVEAYFACDKNEDLAANFLLSQAYDD